MRKLLILAFIITGNSLLFSQPWKDKLPKDKSNYTFFDYQKAFNDYWNPYSVKAGYYTGEKGEKQKAVGWKQFKRWEWYWKSRVDNKTGEFPKYSVIDALNKWEAKYPQKSTLGNWQPLGPSNVNSPDFGTGRINCLTFDPNDNNRYWVGAPGGGVWLTENNGGTWSCLTDDNPVLGVSVIELDPGYNGTTNTTIYIATGDRTVMDNPSVGVLKSTDDGATWQATGFSAGPGEAMKIGGLEIDPSNANTILVGTSIGLYKSTDGGDTWILKQSGSFIDMERKPGSNTVYYASTYGWDPKVYKTDDAGETWTLVREVTGHFRAEIAVTEADANYVYIITSENAYDCGNIERSTDSGDNWTIMYTTTDANLFGWRTSGSDTGGQGFYDIAIAVSNTNRDHVYIGGVNSHFSTDGGNSFTAVTCWSSSFTYNQNGCDVIHADHHNAYFHPVTNRLFDVNDGGVHYTDNITLLDNSTWTDITGGLANGQIYGIGVSQQTNDETVAGFQDNGTKLLPSGVSNWDDVKGGDGMHCDIDVTTDNVQYGTYVELQVDRTTNGWGSRGSIRSGGGADWAGPLEGDPLQAGVIYIGTDAVERYNGSWTDMSTSLNNTTYLLALDVHNDGTNLVIYTADNTDLWRSNTSGTSFVSVKNNLPSNMVTDIAVDYYNPTTTAWVTLGGFDSNNVYMTTDNGATWTNISAGLPELPCNTIVQNRQNSTLNELYVGTDIGVYVKLGDAPWQLYSEGLPNVVISDLEMYYDATPANSIVRAASYGRGVWETDCYDPPALDASVSAIVEPVNEYCNLGNFTPILTLSNIGTNALTSADISYTINGGTPVNQAWSGSLSRGQSTNITFPVETLTYGIHEIIASVSNPNGGSDQNSTNDSYIVIYKVWNNSIPYTQNFDNFTNGGNASSYNGESVALSECWINDEENGVDWSVNSGATGSSGTGPDTYGDHTSGTGKYLYTETSSINNQRADALSPTFDLSGYTGANISFWYHMLGTNMGTLNVDLHYGGVWHDNITVTFNGVDATSLSGSQADEWRQATADISAADGYSDAIVRLRADPTASDYTGDMAIDDFILDASIACIQPTTQATNFNATPAQNSIDISWTRGDGDNILIVAHEGTAVDSDPTYNTSYSANASFGSGDEIGTANYVVYNGTGNSLTLTGLNQSTTYHFALYEYNNTDVCYLTPGLTDNSTTLGVPSLTTSAAGSITLNSAVSGGDVSSLNGSNLTAKGVCWSTSSDPTLSDSYTDDIGQGTGIGTFTSSLTSLNPNTTYYVRAYATNSYGTAYGDNISFSTLKNAPVVQAFNIVLTPGATSVDITWTNGDGDSRIVLMNTSNSFTDPIDGTDPAVNTVYGGSGEQVIFNGTGNSVTVTGLNISTEYWFRVYEYNNAESNTAYYTSTATNNPNSITTLSDPCLITILPWSEDFEGGVVPPDACWASFRGTNGIGTAQDWRIDTDPYAGTYNAFVRYENVTGGNAEDWLVTPSIHLPAGTIQLSFYEKQSYSTNWGSQYSIKVSTSSQTDHAAFTDVSAYDETSFGTAYTQRIVDMSSYAGQTVYIAYVMENDDGDDWHIDDITLERIPTPGYWTGTSSSDWQTAGNWDDNNIPNSVTDVTIPNGCTNYPVIDDDATVAECNDLTIESNADLTIDVNGDMTVSGTIFNNAGMSGLNINSDATGTGSLIQNSPTGVNATVNRFFSASPESWHNLSSPIISAPLSGFPTTNNLYWYNESTDDFWTASSYGSGSISGWTAPPSDLVPTLGYVYYYYQTTLNFIGQLNPSTAGNSVTINYTDHEGSGFGEPFTYANVDGWNFIGNPFTSAIDWNIVDAGAANLYDAIYFYDGTNYSTWVNGTDSWDGAGTNGGNQYIPANQGFFVKSNNTSGGTLNIPAGARTHNDQAFWKESQKPTPINFMRLKIESNNLIDETVIRFLENATSSMDDKMDAFKRFSLNEDVPQIFTSSNNDTEYSVNTLGNLDQTISVPLRILNTFDNYALEITEFNFDDITVYLKDNVLNETTEINLTDNLSIDKSEYDNTDRFELIFEKVGLNISDNDIPNVLVYPNPNTGNFFVEIMNYNKNFNIEIVNILGQIVYQNQFNNFKTEIKMNTQSKGVYFVNIVLTDGTKIFKKIMIE